MAADPRNDESRERLEGLCARLDPLQLLKKTPSGWTVAATLAHLAFWDRFTLERWREYKRSGKIVQISEVSELLNASLAAQWHAVSPADATKMAMEAARAGDANIAALSDEAIQAARDGGAIRMFERFHHRNDHLDEIEAALKS